MASAQEQSASYTVRSSITSLWTTRRKKHNPLSETSQPQNTQDGPGDKVVKAGFSALQKNGTAGSLKAGGQGKEAGRHGDEAPRKRDDEAEVWGFEASMGVGAGKSVKKEDREEVLRGRILGKRRWEDANAKEKQKGKDAKGDDGDSDEEVGRSALGRKKRAARVEPARPAKQVKKDARSEKDVEVNGAGLDTEMKEAREETEKTEKIEEKESEGIESSTPAGDAPSDESKKQKKKKNKKKRKAAAVE